MGQKLTVGPIDKGLKNDRLPFNIDNDSFPVLINSYQWRGRIKRKRGTQLLCRLQRFLGTTDVSGNLTVTISPQPIISGISTFTIGTDIFIDQGGANPVNLLTNSLSGTGVLNRSTGVLIILGSVALTNVFYYPTLPVMGLEEDVTTSGSFSSTIAFDTTYAYNILTSTPYSAYDVSFYKNIATATVGYPGYVQKSTWTTISWNGQNYQQFWSTNFQGAFWVTNGINIPFNITNIGMQFKPITAITGIGGPPAITNLTITGHGLVVGDFIFVNEVKGINGINFQTGYVTVVVDANTVTVEFPNATLSGVYTSNGIAQYLTNRSDKTKDCIRWYDGDPTNGSALAPGFSPGFGWVNFMPPLSQQAFSISDLPPAIYYLVSARMIIPFKDRLVFIGVVIQSSSSNPIYLQDTVIYSQNGTPYYTGSYTSTGNDPRIATVTPLLVPVNQTATPSAFFEDSTGFGGFQTVGIDQPINTAYPNQDVIILGFRNAEAKMVYTGDDIVPFNFYIINSELGSSSTFSGIVMNEGVLTRGDRGFIMTNQTSASRFDLDIPDEVFEMSLTNNGVERVCAQRDYINEWIYFTYPVNEDFYTFPDQTLQYNYRDQSWAIFRESYTTYGQFKRQTGFTWNTVGLTYPTWNAWNDPWNAGESSLLQPQIIGGNQQGFVLIKGIGTGEGTSIAIQNIVANLVTSPNHSLNEGDYIIITDVQGTLSGQVNGYIFQVGIPNANTFTLIAPVVPTTGTYFGGGVITRIYVPFIQTKQFPLGWDSARKTRIGPQMYLLSSTPNSQITLQIYLSQDANNPYNIGTIVPSAVSLNNSLIYSSVLYTCPESTNLGLTPSNINIQSVTANTQSQIWHRVNTSLIGDTVQLGFTMSDAQVRDLETNGVSFIITNASNSTNCILTCASQGLLPNGSLIIIQGVLGMTQLNNNVYNVIASDATTVTIGVNSISFTPYISGGILMQESAINAFSEIELHGFILDVSPSMVLA